MFKFDLAKPALEFTIEISFDGSRREKCLSGNLKFMGTK